MTSLYDISIPVIVNVLNTMSHILKKGEEYATRNSISEDDLLATRIYEDMLPLTNQILIIVSTTGKALEQLLGTGLPSISQEGKTLGELYRIIDKTRQALSAVDENAVNAKAQEEIVFNVGPRFLKKASPVEYIQGYTIPYIYFHLNIAYAILRKRGVPLGKLDYIKDFALNFKDA